MADGRQRHRPRALVIAAVLAVVVVAGLAPVMLGEGRPLCRSCHLMRQADEALRRSPHASLDCVKCHAASLGAGRLRLNGDIITRMIPSALARRDSVRGPALPVARAVCMGCHEDVSTTLTSVGGLRIDHGDCARDVACISCHGAVAHDSKDRWRGIPVMEDCILCHREASAVTRCDGCHDEKLETERLSRGPWQITHGAKWSTAHGMGTTEYCETCHPSDYCVRCHGLAMPHPGDWPTAHGGAAIANRASCLTCHESETICNDCHGTAMPHGEGFLRGHSQAMKKTDDKPCFKCHADDDCANCHANHVHPGGPALWSKGVDPKAGAGR